MEFDSYAVLARQNVEVLSLLKFYFKEIFTAVHRRLNIRPTLNNPWRIVIVHKIFADIFIQFFRTVRNYKYQLGVTITDVKKDRSRKSISVSITFTNLNIFLFHFDKTIGGIDVKKFLGKSVTDCTAKVIIDDEKPALLTYNFKKHLFTSKLHYLATNRYVNIF